VRRFAYIIVLLFSAQGCGLFDLGGSNVIRNDGGDADGGGDPGGDNAGDGGDPGGDNAGDGGSGVCLLDLAISSVECASGLPVVTTNFADGSDFEAAEFAFRIDGFGIVGRSFNSGAVSFERSSKAQLPVEVPVDRVWEVNEGLFPGWGADSIDGRNNN